jgi:hypothetical protein
MSSRRAFIEQCAVGSLFAGAMPSLVHAGASHGEGDDLLGASGSGPQTWDVAWVGRVTGRYKAVFDVPEVDSGYGVWRASIWQKQYNEVMGVRPEQLSAVLVLRHHGIALAMQQAYWDKYGIGKKLGAMHPVTQQPTDRNPALLAASRNEIPADFDALALDKAIGRGVIALACNLALEGCAATIQKADNVSPEAAYAAAKGYLIPGVILQPSGVFAALRAQHAGCAYLRAS